MKISTIDFVLVGIQLVLFGAYIFDVPSLQFQMAEEVSLVNLGLALAGFIIILISILQLNTNLSIFPTPRKDGELVISGLFKYVRHPIYSGILMTTFFFALYSHSGYRLIIFLLLVILFYFKSNYEEKALTKKFPAYSSYRASTGRFFPKF